MTRPTPKQALLTVAMLIVGFVFVFPYLWMVGSGFKTNTDVFRYTSPITFKTFLPVPPTGENFTSLFTDWNFARYMLNSIGVAAAQTLGTLLVCSLAAFALSRMRFRGRNAAFWVIFLCALVPFEAIMIPLYSVTRQLGLLDTYAGLFLPWLASPVGIFLLRQAFLEIPIEYDQAAEVDGASKFQIFWYIVLPNARPALITVALITFLWSWNAFLWPLLVVQSPDKQLLQVALASLELPNQRSAWGLILAGATTITVPILILYVALQKFVFRAFLHTGLKG